MHKEFTFAGQKSSNWEQLWNTAWLAWQRIKEPGITYFTWRFWVYFMAQLACSWIKCKEKKLSAVTIIIHDGRSTTVHCKTGLIQDLNNLWNR